MPRNHRTRPIPDPRSPIPAAAKRRRGSAMIEAVLVLPFLFFVLALVVYFGFNMERFQRATVVDRYESWRGAARAEGPASSVTTGSATRQLQATFFHDDRPDSLLIEARPYFPREPQDDWRDAAAELGPDAGPLAEAYFDEFPRGRSVRLYTTHGTDMRVLRALDRPIRHRHTRLDTDWRFANGLRFDEKEGWVPDNPRVTPGEAVRTVHYGNFDSRLAPYTDNPIANAVRDFYGTYPPYRGPKVYTQWEKGVGWY